jgi:hypothetical protein
LNVADESTVFFLVEVETMGLSASRASASSEAPGPVISS